MGKHFTVPIKPRPVVADTHVVTGSAEAVRLPTATTGRGFMNTLQDSNAIQRTLRCLSCVRYKDPAKVLAPTLIGITCVVQFPLTLAACCDMLALYVAGYVLMAHCLALNDFADGVADSRDPRKAHKAYLNRDVTPAEMLSLTVALGIASLWLIGTVGHHLLPLAAMIIACSLVYSFPHPRFEGKQIPLLSTLMHGFTGILAFLLGYSLWAAADLRGALIGIYFALIYEAGHLILEVQDYAGDQNSGIRTYAVRYGQRPVFVAAALVSVAAWLLLSWLALAGHLPDPVVYIALLYLPILYMFWKLRKASLTFNEVRALSKGFVNAHTVIWGLLMALSIVDRLTDV